MYGIRNCDTIKKARAWLEHKGVDLEFHDFKSAGLDPGTLARWVADIGWETLLNRSGQTWRKLPETRKAAVTDSASATALMLEFPTVIKRPVLEAGKQLLVGFDAVRYASIFDRRQA
jgi:arsenate reductase